MITRICPECSKEFEHYPSRRAVYCSTACRAKAQGASNLGRYGQGKRIDLNCEQCGKAFSRWEALTTKATHHFCGRACYDTWQTGQVRGPRVGNFPSGPNHPNFKGKVDCVCERCGKTFLKFPSQSINGQGRYCSRACTRNRTETNCEHCGKRFEIKAYEVETRRFCSVACKADWQRHHNLGPDSPGWRGGYDPYYGPNWRNQRRAARKRDNYTCQRCGITEERLFRQLDVHHIIPFRTFGIERYREANRLDNLISLCHLCHLTIEPRGEQAS